MKIVYEPEHSESGLTSFIAWENPHLHESLKRAFDIKPHEVLSRVEVTRQGLRAIVTFAKEEMK